MDYRVKIKNIKESCILIKTPADAQGFLAAEISKNFSNSDFVFIAKNDAELDQIHKQINYFLPDYEVLSFYAWDCSPFDRVSPKPQISANRIKTFHRLANRPEGKKFFIVTSINSLLQKTIPTAEIKDFGLYLKIGSKASISQIAEFLVNKGYERRGCANNVGEFAIRGGIIDIVMQQAADLIGYRVDFFGEEVESIKIFDPITQITQEEVKSLEILPASEVMLTKKTIENFRQKYRANFGAAIDDQLYLAISENRTYPGMEHWLPFFYEENLASFFSHLKNPVSFLSDEILTLAKQRDDLVAEYHQARNGDKSYHAINSGLLYLTAEELKKELQKNCSIQFNKFDCEDKNQRILDLEIKPIPDFALAGRANQRDPLELVKEFIGKTQTTIACLSESFRERITKILPDYNLKIPTILLPLNHGFYTSEFMLIGEQAIFGEKLVRKKTSRAASQRLIEEGLAIQVGELVVHRDHGIGRFEGITTVVTAPPSSRSAPLRVDMIKIAYGGNETLFVPVSDIDLITRYGADNPLIQLDRLGVAGWKTRREKVKKRIKVAAEELLKIAAARHLKKAEIFIPEQHFYDEFRNRFGFVETEDQMRAIEEVEEDLAKGSPMDRLICGDVGFGKTEVAMRAAAVVASNKQHHQIAIVAPTTLLARQHFKNFTKRFDGTGVKIAQLSRLVTASEAKKTRDEIESGSVQIAIGTHSLLQKNIKFKNLSLVIIDEEQHFGVAQKERLKELRNEVHVLTLSATPIPRSLQMSLTGVKDLSLISTPPLDRLAVRNFVMPYDSVIVREAVMREYNRGGRVFFVVPRVRDIEEIEPRLKILLPEIRITHAHGQMSPNELDKIMNEFIDGKIDMLLSTTIIESGIDISEANTMIIYKSEMFGLSQLYQLRGRVGRGKVRGYCYLMLDSRKKVKDEAQKKLEVMQNLDSLGVGFTVATHDMDIRGSGNLLGDEQSGHVKETGVELYQQMLLETIEDLKNNSEIKSETVKVEDIDYTVQIKLGISLLISEEYIADLPLRMSFYKKIAAIKSDEDAMNLIDEMNDRFGKVPAEVINLTEISKIKYSCRKLGIDRLESVSEGIVVGFRNNQFREPDKLLAMIFASKNKIKLHGGQRVLFVMEAGLSENKISAVFSVIKKLESL